MAKLVKQYILSFIAILAIAGCNQAQTDTISYLALGDSYTIGESVNETERYPEQIAKMWSTKTKKVNTTIVATTGWRTDDLIEGIEHTELEPMYDIVSLLIGVNNQYQGRAFEQYKSEFPKLLSKAINLACDDTSHVFVVSIPDYFFTPFGQEKGTDQISTELDQYNAFAREICRTWNVAFIDITPISRKGIQKHHLVASDGLHPSGEQYKLWAQEIYKNWETKVE